jgi:hypothetical protein
MGFFGSGLKNKQLRAAYNLLLKAQRDLNNVDKSTNALVKLQGSKNVKKEDSKRLGWLHNQVFIELRKNMVKVLK